MNNYDNYKKFGGIQHEKRKKLFKKAFAGLMAIALFTTGIYMPGIITKQVKAAEDEIVLPITLRDFNADNLLFEWCLEKDSIKGWGGSEVPYLSFSDATFAGRISGAVFNGGTVEYDGETFDASYVEKLVQDDLVNGHPQYRQETIEAVAEVVKGALEVPVTYDMKNYYASDRAHTYQEELYRKVRAKLGTPVGDGNQDIKNPYEGFENQVIQAPGLYAVTVKLGSYIDTKARADAGQLNFNSMTTAMDYAYYVMNNFFVSKNDINTTYNNFQNITLKGDGQGNYTFDARKGETVGYHDDTKNISNNTSGATYTTNTGLFPLDRVNTNEGIYLDSFSQASIDYAPADDPVKTKTPGQPHNFHYSLAGHSRFYYYNTL